MTISTSTTTLLLAACLLVPTFGQSNGNAASIPRFIVLTQEVRARLERQRAVVAAAVKQRYGTPALRKTQADLPILQRLIDEKVFSNTQTYELQSLGVAFGDVLASELPLSWAMVTDEYGTDPTLRFKKTNLHVNVLTMISKRVETGEPVNLRELLHTTRDQLAIFEKQARSAMR